MIVNAAIQEILNCKPGDEILVGNQEEYFQGSPQLQKVRDIVKENGKLIILV